MPRYRLNAVIEQCGYLAYLSENGVDVNPLIVVTESIHVELRDGENGINATGVFEANNDVAATTQANIICKGVARLISFSIGAPVRISSLGVSNTEVGSNFVTSNMTERICIISPSYEAGKAVLDIMANLQNHQRISNAIYYFDKALNENEDNKIILELYKAIESIFGNTYAEEILQEHLSYIGQDDTFYDLKRVRCLRGHLDGAHASEEPQNVVISQDDLNLAINTVRNLVTAVMNYINNGGDEDELYNDWGLRRCGNPICTRCVH